MRLSRTELVPVLTIIAGGAVGVLLTIGASVGSPSDGVVTPHRDVVPSVVTPSEPIAPAEPQPQLRRRPEPRPRITQERQGPTFTPMTVRPELTNRGDVIAALMREYPAVLRDAGVGGQVVVWFFISETGRVLDRRISRSSGHERLDEAALKVADVYRFAPALNRDERVAVWIQLPITFTVRLNTV